MTTKFPRQKFEIRFIVTADNLAHVDRHMDKFEKYIREHLGPVSEIGVEYICSYDVEIP